MSNLLPSFSSSTSVHVLNFFLTLPTLLSSIRFGCYKYHFRCRSEKCLLAEKLNNAWEMQVEVNISRKRARSGSKTVWFFWFIAHIFIDCNKFPQLSTKQNLLISELSPLNHWLCSRVVYTQWNEICARAARNFSTLSPCRMKTNRFPYQR